MNIIICGAGDVGSYTAESLAEKGHRTTVIDVDAAKLTAIEEAMDVRTLLGNCADATKLREAGAEQADMVVAATDMDEINLLTATVAKRMGAAKSIARVHHSAFFDPTSFDYDKVLNIDRLICPEKATAVAIARKLRNPGAVALEEFAQGAIVMQQVPVGRSSPTVGRSLSEIGLPHGVRLGAVTRKGGTFVPEATTTIDPDDTVILVGNALAFKEARRLFADETARRQKVVIMGGTPMAVWLCRSLRNRNFSIRLFESDRKRAEELAEKLDWVTVLRADPTDRGVFHDENLSQADVFIPLLDDENTNIISAVYAKMQGIPTLLTVVQTAKYLDVAYDIGIDDIFSKRNVAAKEIEAVLEESPLRLLESLAADVINVYRVRVTESASVVGKPLKLLKLSPDWMVAALMRDDKVFVPGADDVLATNDVVLMIGRSDQEAMLRKLFITR